MKYLLHHSILEQAEVRPDAEAFSCRGVTVTYLSLRQQAAQLANALLALGLQPMDRVGIYMGKGIELPVATYGVLLAGGAYVPLDPSAPQHRIEFALRDCSIKILITSDSKRKSVEKIASDSSTPLRHVIGLSKPANAKINSLSWSEVAHHDVTPPATDTREDDLAYVMYTSGSTGTPKGLMHTHASGLAYARYSAELYRVAPSDILGNHAPLHFDISTFEFLTGPYAGAKSVLIPEEDMLFPASLADLIEHERLTFWYSVPLALIQMIDSGRLSEVDTSSLRWILFGGEPFQPKYAEQLSRLIPTARLCNVYGPAEVNQCTYFHLPSGYRSSDEAIPLGQIWSGARGLIVDSERQPVSSGETGELLVSSPTMMKGYWGREDLNRNAFHYEEPIPGFVRRYYCTGDLVTEDENGVLKFLGRKDRQVKIRGYRIELDEVEAAFTSQDPVQEAAAITLEVNDEKQIVVFVSLQKSNGFDPSLSLEIAREKLPRYGVPSRIEVLPTFPRTTSGKIDRSELARTWQSNPTPTA